MNTIDLLIVLWLVSAALRGFSSGFIRQVLSFCGFILGLIAGSWLTPQLSHIIKGDTSLLIPGIAITLGLAVVFSVLGEMLAVKLKDKIKITPVHHINNVLGALIGAIFVLVASWLIASAITRLPFANLGLTIEQSRVVQTVNNVMPPAPGLMDKLGRLITPQGFPQVFVGQEPQSDPAGPPATAEVEAAAAKAHSSMARIEGYACGNISTGSGFVAAPHYVVTNAHVVAGVRQPIILQQGKRYSSTVVLFNAEEDLAVLRTDARLPGLALPLANENVERGTSAAVLGFPGGGPLTVSPGVILNSQMALGRDIYGRSLVTREIYTMQTNIGPGNSGGPVVLPDGRVVGVIFGEAVTQEGLGYALTAREIADDVDAALTKSAAVSSGPCV